MEMVNIEQVKQVLHATEILPEEELAHLIDDCRDIITEGVTAVREKVIETKWELGDRLLKEGEERITPLLSRVSVELHTSQRDLFRCLAFRKKFPTLKETWERLPEGKNISWHKLINHYIGFELPKPVLPVEEKFDEWGITDWWQQQKDLHVLKIKNKNNGFTLVFRQDQVKEEDRKRLAGPISEQYKEISDYYIKLKRWDIKDLDRSDYNRMYKSIKIMLEKANYDKARVIRAIKWCHDKYFGNQIDWTLETVVKKYPEACRPVKDYEKYLKKPEQGYYKR